MNSTHPPPGGKQPILTRFSPANPCPVCGTGSKGCSATADGLHLCRGEPADPAGWRQLSKREDAAGFRHYRRPDERADEPRPTFTPPKADTAAKDWTAEAERHAKRMDADARAELAAALKLPADALAALPLIGTNGRTSGGRTFTVPECDGTGRIVGLNQRFADGSKKVLKGGHRGLTIPAGWRDRPGPVFVVEGASDTLAMTHAGLSCVGRPSNSGGADHLAALLTGWPAERGIVVCGENDAKPDGTHPGRAGAVSVAERLAAALRRPVVWALPPAGAKDAREWLTSADRGEASCPDRGAELAAALLAAAMPIDPPAADPPPVSVRNWPDPPAEEAYHGLAGRIVRTLGPHSEADPVALLVQTLILFGSVVGRGPHFAVEGDKHFTNQFAALVGPTAAGRKGTSFGRVRSVFTELDADWLDRRIVSGTSSGEGLLWAVRDPITKRERVNAGRGCPPTFADVEADPGEPDKRAVVYEPEFAGVLKQTERQGNTASVVLRQLWDGREVVQTLTKNNPAKATAAHVSMIGHITPEELARYLTATETANGFANRFLFACVRRSKCLPDGGTPPAGALPPLRAALAAAVAFARGVGEVTRHSSACGLWHGVYPILTGERAGLSGALSARAAPHVLRLALLYALLDHSPDIRPVHLMAGIALWDYCERSVGFLFGDRTGNPVADEVRDLLRDAPNGLTRSELVAALGRHQFGDKLTAALVTLEGAGLARREKVDTGGRPAERWFAATRTTTASPLMTTARRLFAECPKCDGSDRSDESPAPPEDPPPPFGRNGRFHRTPAGQPAPADPPAVWDDVDQFFTVMTRAGWKWPRVVRWLNKEHAAALPPDAVFFAVGVEHRRNAVDHLRALPPSGKGGAK